MMIKAFAASATHVPLQIAILLKAQLRSSDRVRSEIVVFHQLSLSQQCSIECQRRHGHVCVLGV